MRRQPRWKPQYVTRPHGSLHMYHLTFIPLANSANCCSGSHNTPATCPPSGVAFYSYFSEYSLAFPSFFDTDALDQSKIAPDPMLTLTMRAAEPHCGPAPPASMPIIPSRSALPRKHSSYEKISDTNVVHTVILGNDEYWFSKGIRMEHESSVAHTHTTYRHLNPGDQ